MLHVAHVMINHNQLRMLDTDLRTVLLQRHPPLWIFIFTTPVMSCTLSCNLSSNWLF